MTESAGNKSRRNLAPNLVIVGLALALVLSACGGSSTSPKVAPVKPAPSPSKVVLDSVQTTAAAKSARIAITTSIPGSPASLGVNGVTDFTTGDSQMTTSILGGDIVERSVDGVLYMQLPSSLGAMIHVPAGTQWLSLPLPKLGSSAAGIGGSGQTDPTQMLASLEAASSDVTKVGTATVRGVETTHYHAVLDLGKAIGQAKVPAALRKSLQQMISSFGGKASAIPADAFVDSDGRLRRLTERVTLGPIGNFTTTMDLYDFGVPVNVQAPPADQVAPFSSVGGLGGLLGGASGASGAAA